MSRHPTELSLSTSTTYRTRLYIAAYSLYVRFTTVSQFCVWKNLQRNLETEKILRPPHLYLTLAHDRAEMSVVLRHCMRHLSNLHVA